MKRDPAKEALPHDTGGERHIAFSVTSQPPLFAANFSLESQPLPEIVINEGVCTREFTTSDHKSGGMSARVRMSDSIPTSPMPRRVNADDRSLPEFGEQMGIETASDQARPWRNLESSF